MVKWPIWSSCKNRLANQACNPAALRSPDSPFIPRSTTEKFEIRSSAASFDQTVLLVRFSTVLALSAGNQVHLTAAGIKSARVFPPNAEEDDLGDISEIEPDTSAIRATIFPHFVPDQVRFVFEAPRIQNVKTPRQKRVGNPEIAMRRFVRQIAHRQCRDLFETQSPVSLESTMFRRDLARAVGEAPWRIRKDRTEFLSRETGCQIARGAHVTKSRHMTPFPVI